jgi:hypothetical protein
MMLAEKILNCLFILARGCMGAVIVYSGAQLLSGGGLLSSSEFDSKITGVFVIVLGLYCIFSGVVKPLLEYMQQKGVVRKL